MSDGWPGDEIREQASDAIDESKELRAALEDAARSLEVLSLAGMRRGSDMLQDLIDVRGYAASRARVAREALERS